MGGKSPPEPVTGRTGGSLPRKGVPGKRWTDKKKSEGPTQERDRG